MDSDEKLVKHLEMIQGVINRLAGNSFAVKGWSATLVSALIAIAVDKNEGKFVLIALVPALLFWVLDGYFLWQERLFRGLYGAARLGKLIEPNQMFTMDTRPYKSTTPSWLRTTFEVNNKQRPNTLLHFHGALILCILLAALLLIGGSARRIEGQEPSNHSAEKSIIHD